MASDFLATTAISDFWDKQAEKIIFLGTWCLRHDRRGDWQGLNYEVMPHPWDDREAMHRAALYEEAVYEKLLAALGDYLNAAHRENHGRRYWRLILGPWLLQFVQVAHERYLCLEQALRLYPGCRTLGLAKESWRIPRAYWDHLRGSGDDAYNLQLYTAILAALGYPVQERPYSWGWPEAGGEGVFGRLRRWLKRRMVRWALRAPVLLADMYLPRRQVMQLMAATGFKARWCELPKPESWLPDPAPVAHPGRAGLADLGIGQDDEFTRVLGNTLPAHLPLSYLEGYPACRDWLTRIAAQSGAKAALSAIGFFGDDTFKMLAARLQEQGVKLVDIQHGGLIGSARYNTVEVLQRKTGDEFWSWGWGRETPGIRPMASPKLSWLAAAGGKNHRARPPYIYYVGNIVPRYFLRAWSCPMGPQVEQYLDWQVRFLQGLHPPVRAGVIHRPHPQDFGWGVRERLKEAVPDLNWDTPRADYYEGLLGAALVACDMNQTTILESLAANRPTLAFWDPRLWELRPDAEPHFRRLAEVSILHYSPEEAARALNQLWPRVQDWWSREAVQAAREEFVRQFALASPDWVGDWRRELQAIWQ